MKAKKKKKMPMACPCPAGEAALTKRQEGISEPEWKCLQGNF